MKYLLITLLLLPMSAFAEKLCEPVKSKGEGHWPIPEEAFTKENAQRSLAELTSTFEQIEGPILDPKEIDGLAIEPHVMERLIIIKGFTLKSSAITDRRLDEDHAQWSKKAFCDFLKNEAFAWH